MKISLRVLAAFAFTLQLTWAQNYLTNESYGPRGSPLALTVASANGIISFANSPWPKHNAHAIRVEITRATLRRFLETGKAIPSDPRAWEEASSIKFTLPKEVYAQFPHLAEREATGDPTLYAVFCEGVFAVAPTRIYFWRMLNDRYLYVSDSSAACLLRVDEPIHAEAPADQTVRCLIAREAPRSILAISELPEWMRAERWADIVSLRTVEEIFSGGRYLQWNRQPEQEFLDRREIPVFEMLRQMPKDSISGGLGDRFEIARAQMESISELAVQAGVFLLPTGCFVFWRSLNDKMLEVRSADGAMGIVLLEN